MKAYPIYLLLTLWVSLGNNCGIEVGNPGDVEEEEKASGKSMLTIEIADAPIDNAKHVYLLLSELSMVDVSGNEYSLDLTANAKQSIDILSLQDGVTEILVKQQSVPTGSYSGFVLTLASNDNSRLVTLDGVEHPLSLPNDSTKQIYINGNFNLQEGSENIVLHIDVRQSLKVTEGAYLFDPVISVLPREDIAILKGRANVLSGVICAYLENEGVDVPQLAYEPPQSQQDIAEENHQRTKLSREDANKTTNTTYDGKKLQEDTDNGKTKNSSKQPSRKARPPAKTNANAEVCESAYGSVPIKEDGSFKFDFLEKGEWSLRIFSDGSSYDNNELFILKGTDELDIGLQTFNLNTGISDISECTGNENTENNKCIAAQFWRLSIDSISDGSRARISQPHFYIDGAWTTGVPVAGDRNDEDNKTLKYGKYSAECIVNQGQRDCPEVFFGDPDDEWRSVGGFDREAPHDKNTTEGRWLGLDFGQAGLPSGFRFQSHRDEGCPDVYQMEFSNDGINWTPVPGTQRTGSTCGVLTEINW